MTRVRIIVTITLLLAGIMATPATSQLTDLAQAQQAQDDPTHQWNDRLTNWAWTKCAINSDNSLWCWSDTPEKNTSEGRTPIYSTTPTKVEGVAAKAVSAGTHNICAIAIDNELWCWESTTKAENNDQPADATPSTSLKKMGIQAKKVALFHSNAYVIDTNNDLWEWERGSEINPPIQFHKRNPTMKAKDVYSDSYATCTVDLENKVWCWDKSKLGVPGKVTPNRSETPVLISGVTAEKIIVDDRYACALNSAGEVWCWGDNFDGQLGSETPGSTSTPTKVDKLPKDIVDITLNQSSTCAVDRSGSSWCWGKPRPEFGNTPDINYPEVPTKTTMKPARVLRIDNRVCLVDTAGYVWCTKDEYDYDPGDQLPNYSFEKKENIRLIK